MESRKDVGDLGQCQPCDLNVAFSADGGGGPPLTGVNATVGTLVTQRDGVEQSEELGNSQGHRRL